ncbi:MAG TPA: hypothetical protein VH987_09365 [Candidatus Limnocylindria bacterium]
MSRTDRILALGLLLLAILVGIGLVAFAANACPGELPGQPCPEGGTNRLVVIIATGAIVTLFATSLAFLSAFVLRRRIVYRGAWARAALRGVLLGALVVALGGLRLGGALSVPVTMFVALLAAALEWFAIRRLDRP